MSDFSSMGARMVAAHDQDNALQEENRKIVQADALEAFLKQNPTPDQLIRRVALMQATVWAGQREIREHLQQWMVTLVANDLLDDADIEILSEHVFRRLGDAQSTADNLHHLHDELMSIDLEAILTRYKGKL